MLVGVPVFLSDSELEQLVFGLVICFLTMGMCATSIKLAVRQ